MFEKAEPVTIPAKSVASPWKRGEITPPPKAIGVIGKEHVSEKPKTIFIKQKGSKWQVFEDDGTTLVYSASRKTFSSKVVICDAGGTPSMK